MTTGQARGRRAAAFALLWTAAAFVWAATETRSGTVQILTADDFASGHAEHIVTLVSSRGALTALKLPPGVSLDAGARVAVHGAPDGDAFTVESIEVLEAAPVQPPAITGNSTVIAIL